MVDARTRVENEFFKGRDLEAYPKPWQAPRPALINAGNSPRGIEFSSRNVDVNFASLDTLENIDAYTKKIRGLARDKYQREIDVMTYGLVVCRPTEAEAKRDFQDVVDKGDWAPAGNVINIALSGASQSFDHAREMSERFIAGWGGYPLVGTPVQVVQGMKELNDAGTGGGMIMGMIDFNEEMKFSGDEVMQLMIEAGLRHA